MVEIQDVSLSYSGKDKSLSHINLSVNDGECILLCGESGSGKTSVTKLINGLIPHYDEIDFDGQVIVSDMQTKDTKLFELSKEVSSVFQNPKTHFFNVDTTSELIFALENLGYPKEETKSRLEDATRLFHIEHLLNRSIFDLSGGEKQILSIAAAYMTGTKWIVLDEPSSNLDAYYTELVRQMLCKLKQEGVGIVISEHRFSFLKEIVDRVYYLHKGEIRNIWKKEKFFSLSDKERKKLGLRSLIDEPLREKMNDDNDGERFFINELSCVFPKNDIGIEVKNQDFTLGNIIGVVGKNGSGKSTFIKSLIGLNKNAKMDIEIAGKKQSKKEMIKNSYLVMQDVNHQLFAESVEEEVALEIPEENKEKVEEVLTELGLWELRDVHPMSLSGGQKQRVAIASALLSGAKIICFDEPTSGMDYGNMLKISNLIQRISSQENIIFIISHDYEFLNYTIDRRINVEEFKKKKEKNVIGKLLEYAKEDKRYFYHSIIYMLLSTLAWIGSFLIAYLIINGFLMGKMNTVLWIRYMVILFGTIFSYGFLKGHALKLSHLFAYSALGEIRKDFIEKMARNPLGFTLSQPAGAYRQKIVDSVEEIEVLLAHGLPEVIPYIFSSLTMQGSLEMSKFIMVILLCFAGVVPLTEIQHFFPILAVLGKKIKDLEDDFQSPSLHCGDLELSDKNLNIEYRQVSFKYDKVNVIDEVSFDIQSGETVALVGESGSGKSTLAKLLMHYYEPNSGEILIGGQSIQAYTLDSLMDRISYVSQDNFLFDISIRENIMIGNPEATEEEVIEAAKVAHIHDFIMTLEKGYDTKVGDSGSKLSGGERQRICIARAMLKNASIVILDEATSYTDPENEYYINQGIDALCKNKIVIIIAHKLFRIMDADKIILMDQGKVAAIGTHEELLKHQIYHNLWSGFLQAKEFEFTLQEVEHV